MNRVTTSPCGVPTAIHLPLPYLTGHGEGELEGRGGVANDACVESSEPQFIQLVRTDFGGDRDLVLLPPCCGRGTACPQLALTPPDERRWPNGEELDVCEINSIPQAFLTFTQDAVPPRKLLGHLKPFKRLLGSLMPQPPSAPSAPPESDGEGFICTDGPDPASASPATAPATAASPTASPATASPATASPATGTASPAVTSSPATTSAAPMPSWCMNLPSDLETEIANQVESLTSGYKQGSCPYSKANAEATVRKLTASQAGYGPQPARGWVLAKPYNLSEREWSQKVNAKAEREWSERLAQGIHTFARLQGATAELWLADLKAQC